MATLLTLAVITITGSFLYYQSGFSATVTPPEVPNDTTPAQPVNIPDAPGPLLVVPETPLGILGATAAIAAAFGLMVIAKKK
jgi:hypothetical protein